MSNFTCPICGNSHRSIAFDGTCPDCALTPRYTKQAHESELAALRSQLADQHKLCNGSCDISLASLQVGPDAIVPGNARECAELWKREADRLRSQLAAALTSRKFKQCPTCGMDVYEDTMTNGSCMECVEKRLAAVESNVEHYRDIALKIAEQRDAMKPVVEAALKFKAAWDDKHNLMPVLLDVSYALDQAIDTYNALAARKEVQQ